MIDTIIVGAGPSGLCAAKTFLQCDPSLDLIIFDAQTTIGGVWAKEKIYPSLKTNTHFGGFDFSDFPMQECTADNEDESARRGHHMPGTVVHDFLRQYARQWNLEAKIQFNTKVTEVTRLDEIPNDNGAKWRVTLESDAATRTETCRKLIIATGITNAPNRSAIKGSEKFDAPILHSSEMGLCSQQLMNDPKIETIAVLGGGKSACDAVYMAASSGKRVEWIIRKSGKGPVWMFPLETKMGPFTALRTKLPMRRIVSWFSPCLWDDGYSWVRSLIHATTIGKLIARKFWTQLHLDTIRDSKYREDQRTKALEPETSPFWYGTTAGAFNYSPPLFHFIKSGLVTIHRSDITHLTSHAIHISDPHQPTLHADALIQATGFTPRPTLKFSPPSIRVNLGVPTSLSSQTNSERSFWSALDAASDQTIHALYPRLTSGPFQSPSSQSRLNYNPGSNPSVDACTPFRLYRCIAPPSLTTAGDRSLVFLGMFSNFANNTRLEIQCLWAHAYLSGNLAIDLSPLEPPQNTSERATDSDNDSAIGMDNPNPHKSPSVSIDVPPMQPNAVFREASLMSRYSHHRTPFGHGPHFPDHVFDQLPYFDVLLRDLGLESRRKAAGAGWGLGWLREAFAAYEPSDYRGIVGEWIERNRKV